MRNAISLSLLLATATLAGCAANPSATDTTSNTTTTNTVVENTNTTDAASTPVPFQEVGDSILDASYSAQYEQKKNGYKRFEFTDATGTCAEQGLFDFAYKYDENLKYYVIESLDGSYRDARVGMTGSRMNYMDEVPLTGGEASCEVVYVTGENDADITCKVAEAEVCTGEVTITAYDKQ